MKQNSQSRFYCSGSINSVWRELKHSSSLEHSTPCTYCVLQLFCLGDAMSLCNSLSFLPACLALLKAEHEISLQLFGLGWFVYIICQSSKGSNTKMFLTSLRVICLLDGRLMSLILWLFQQLYSAYLYLVVLLKEVQSDVNQPVCFVLCFCFLLLLTDLSHLSVLS